MSEYTNVLGRFADPSFPAAVAAQIRKWAEVAAQTYSTENGVAALHAAANHVQSLDRAHPLIAALYAFSMNGYEPSPKALYVLQQTGGAQVDVPSPETVFLELVVAELEDRTDAVAAGIADADAKVAAAERAAEEARAQLVETSPLLERVAELEHDNAAQASQLADAAEQIKFLKAGLVDRAKETAPKGARKAAAA